MGGAFDLEPRDKFVEVNRGIVEYELRPGNTVTFMHLVDLTRVEAIRLEAAVNGRSKPSYTAFVVKAIAVALKEMPFANRRVCRTWWAPPFWGARLQRFEAIDVAVACERALPGAESVAFVDVLRDADSLSLDEVTNWLKNLADCDVETNQQWRDFSRVVGGLPTWLAKRLIRLPYYSPKAWVRYRGGAVLVSSPAKYGVDSVAATWSWPLGVSFGFVSPRPVVRDGVVVAHPTFYFTLNFDRRVMAGAPAARFFRRLVDALERADEIPSTPRAIESAAIAQAASAGA